MSTRDLLDPSLEYVLAAISPLSGPQIERASGVTASTIRAWRSGKVRSPQNKTMEFALKAAGYQRIIVRLKD